MQVSSWPGPPLSKEESLHLTLPEESSYPSTLSQKGHDVPAEADTSAAFFGLLWGFGQSLH